MKVFIVLALIAAPLVVSADTPTMTQFTPAELDVIAHYHEGNVMEIDLARTAIARGTPAVKSYAEMLLRDHSDSDSKLKALVKQTGQSIPMAKGTEAAKQQRAETKQRVDALKKLKGADFDRAYLRLMIDEHERELANIDAMMAMVHNRQLAQALTKKKDTLRRHAEAARALLKSIPAN